jgi:acyl-CoA dehydrogenase
MVRGGHRPGRSAGVIGIYETEDLTSIRRQTRKFVEEQVVPVAREWEEAGSVPRTVLRQMGELGFFGLRVPEEFDGLGLGPLASVVMAEELGRSTFGGFAITVLVHTDLAMPYLLGYGNDDQKRKWLPSMMSGETLTAIAVTEPDAGSDVAAIRTRAVRDGAGYRIDGAKLFITNGSSADLVFVAVRTNPETKGSRAISIFGVEKGTEGFRVGRTLEKMGWHSSDTAELIFEDCWVPEEHLIGTENRGFYYIMENFQNERLVLAGQALGEAQKALEMTVEYTKSRRAFGSALYDKQTVRQRLAMLRAKVEAGRQLTYHAAWLRQQGEGDAAQEVSMVKSYVGELVNEVMYACVQYHGGMGYMRESPIERMYRDARIHSIGGGATEVMLDEIAKRS